MLIKKSKLSTDLLKGKTILITGGGGGIGKETVRAFAWLGANVIVAEIDEKRGRNTEKSINQELNTDRVRFYHIDISNKKQIDELYLHITTTFGHLDVLFNNATITPLGAIDDVSIEDWDISYSVNLRAPILLIQKFLPDMKKRNSGIIVFVPSSGAAPFMGAYEIYKTAQVELCNTLAGELEGTNIITYAIGPGLVKTETALKGIEIVAKHMGMSTEEFYKMNEAHILDEETAGTGFAASVALADKYNGQEIGAIQALIDAGVFPEIKQQNKQIILDASQLKKINLSLKNIIRTYNEQYEGWLERSIFERQWVLRDFKKTVGKSSDEIRNIINHIEAGEIFEHKSTFVNLKKYYKRQLNLLQGYEKDPVKLEENITIILSWIDDLDAILSYC